MEELTQQLLAKVKQNKKYKTISDEIVLEEIRNFLKKNPKTNKPSKDVIKDIRKNLHRIYSSYQIKDKNKRKKLLEELGNKIKNNENIDEINKKLLQLAISTKERLNFYPEIYRQIFEITGIPNTIIDLASGLNPLSFPFMDLKRLNLYSYDIDSEDIDFLNKYYALMKPFGLNAKAQISNILDFEKIKYLPSSDIVFLWKLIDLINTKNSKPGEELIKALINKTRFIVASFATKTLSGKPMNLPRRKGFELMLERLNLKFQAIKIPGEIFYVISR